MLDFHLFQLHFPQIRVCQTLAVIWATMSCVAKLTLPSHVNVKRVTLEKTVKVRQSCLHSCFMFISVYFSSITTLQKQINREEFDIDWFYIYICIYVYIYICI